MFAEHYQATPECMIKAPGRANIIGEHTDYNGGWVLPFAIDKGIYLTGKKNQSNTINLLACDVQESQAIELHQAPLPLKGWAAFLQNVVALLQEKNHPITGFDMAFGGDLPIGAGLSSSSALTCGFIALCNALFDLGITKSMLVDYASIAENGTGLRGGKMDQSAIVFAQDQSALQLDCQTSTYQHIKIPTDNGYDWILLDSHVKHNLVNTEYNTRRDECDQGLALLQKTISADLTFRDLQATHINRLDDPILKNRLTHYIQENQRVMDMVTALQNNDVAGIQSLLRASHHSLSQYYEVSCPQLDFLAEEVNALGFGGRMMGGGFGGCLIAYVPGTEVVPLFDSLKRKYSDSFAQALSLHTITPSPGLRQM